MAVIYLFGDSITYGAWDIEGSGWTARLRKYLDEVQLKDDSKYYLCYNLGIPGETTDGLVGRFDRELSARERLGEEAVFVFAFGANDSVHVPSMNGFRVPEDRFIRNMKAAIDSARTVSKNIILANITPVDEAVCASRYGAKDKVRLNKNVERYNDLIAAIAQEKMVPAVDVYRPFVDSVPKVLLSEDGLHPNEKGHQLIFELVRDALSPLL